MYNSLIVIITHLSTQFLTPVKRLVFNHSLNICRVRYSITNPAYVLDGPPNCRRGENLGTPSLVNEAMAKMMTLDKCDMFCENPLFDSGLHYKDQVRVILY